MRSSIGTSGRLIGAVRSIVAAIFLAAGSAMLLGMPWMVALFDRIGIGQWFRFLTGALEVTGGILLLRPSTRNLGALLLLLIMFAAIATHLFVIGGKPIPAIVLAIACVWLLVGDKGRGSNAVGPAANSDFIDSSEATK